MLEKIQAEISRGADVSIIAVVSLLIEHAFNLHASDIHLDPIANGVRVRFRIDGVLQDILELPKDIHQEIISRIKVLGGLRTDEHQTAQDGRLRHLFENVGPIDIRISITPTYFGENAVLRLLSDKAESFALETLGFSAKDSEKLTKGIRKPYGMILSTGPTGSGKTTTLYTILKSLNTPNVSIVTIEDPIEYAIEGVKQIQVNPGTGLTFSSGLRSILRQDPNIIMVGEIRDAETASIAVNTALTGHLLLSTIHTNDAATTLPRLLDMGIEPFLVASTVNIAIGQRLVRKICDKCKTKTEITDRERAALLEVLPDADLSIPTWNGKGCATCNKSGYRGRIAINEVLEVDPDVREALLRKASASEIKQIAVKNGMTTILEDGLDKIKQGITTVSEVFRVIHE